MVITALDLPSARLKIVSKEILSNNKNVANIPRAKPKSPTLLTRKALIAAAQADERSCQKPISR